MANDLYYFMTNDAMIRKSRATSRQWSVVTPLGSCCDRRLRNTVWKSMVVTTDSLLVMVPVFDCNQMPPLLKSSIPILVNGNLCV